MFERKQIRRQVRMARRQLSSSAQCMAARQLVSQVSQAPHLAQADKVALYLAHDGELNTRPLIDWYWAQGTQVFLPVLHPFCAGHLLFLRYQAHTPMIANAFGIAEPKLDIRFLLPQNQLDIIFTPLVAFDSAGNRIGMGGGFYDRTLSGWRHGVGPRPVGLAHDCQHLPAIPTDHWDIPLPELITPAQHWHFS